MQQIKIFFILITFAFCSVAGKTQVIPVDSVQDYLGRNVTVYGRVVEASFNYAKKKDTSIFKMNDVATGKTLRLVITPEVRAAFGYRPENVLLNKLVYIKGVPQKNDLILQMQINGPFDIGFSPERFSEKPNQTPIQQLPADVVKIMIQADEASKKSVIEIKESVNKEFADKTDKPEGQKSINTSGPTKMPANNESLDKGIKEAEATKEALNKAEEIKKAAVAKKAVEAEQKRAIELAAQAQKDEDAKKEALRKEEEYKLAMKKATEISAQIRKDEEDAKNAELAAQGKKNEEAAKDSLRQEEVIRKTEQKKKDDLAEKIKKDEAAKTEGLRKEEEYREELKKSAEIAAQNKRDEEARKAAKQKNEEDAKNELIRKAAEQQKADDLAALSKKNEEAKKAEAINEEANKTKPSQGNVSNNTNSNNQPVRPKDKNDELVGTEIILKSGVNLKGGPGGFFLTIGSITKGEIVKIISCSFDWCKIARVKPIKGKNIEGYVKADKLL